MLEAEHFRPLMGLRVGLITNQSGVDADGRDFVRLIRNTPGLSLDAIFTPEHGLYGKAEGVINSGFDAPYGLPIFSLYGRFRRPTSAMLDEIDALVFDVQDSGARFYTYVTTMAYAMEAAASHHIRFYVLDRPDPISAAVVQGPVMDVDLKSFNRSEWYDQTGPRWIAQSPNLRTLAETTLYPGVGMVEGANVSVGRGTSTPFELMGAPWIDADALSAYLSSRRIAGVRFEPAGFVPSADRYKDQLCHGVRISLEDRYELDSPALGIELITALYRLYPRHFEIDSTLGMVGSARTLREIKSGQDTESNVQHWRAPLEKFRSLRSKYLLY